MMELLGNDPCIIAEVGCNHGGDAGLAAEMIAAAAGADHEVVEVPACVRCRNLDDRAALLRLRTLQSACLTLWLQRRLYAACCRRAVFWLTAAAREHSQGA